MITFQTIADSVLFPRELPTNFAVHGRRSSYGNAGSKPSGFSIRPYFPQTGEIYNDWSWKPSPEVASAISRGNSKCNGTAFNLHLAGLSDDERQRVLTAKHEYESGHAIRMQSLERVIADQMEGWKETGGSRHALGAVSLTASRI